MQQPTFDTPDSVLVRHATPAAEFIIIRFKASPSDCKSLPQAVTHKRRTRGAEQT
jgi:hypothetical protein